MVVNDATGALHCQNDSTDRIRTEKKALDLQVNEGCRPLVTVHPEYHQRTVQWVPWVSGLSCNIVPPSLHSLSQWYRKIEELNGDRVNPRIDYY